MTSGIDFDYGLLPYLYPLIDTQPVIRIPVAGPAPYNTLVIVRGSGSGFLSYSDGNVHRYSAITSTSFHLAEFDERVGTPPPHHSTSVSMHLAEFTNSCEFLLATDSVTGYFDPLGVWTVRVELADEADDEVLGAWGYYYSSWVLCYEPPVEKMPEGGPWRFAGEQMPNLGYLLPAPPQPGDRKTRPRQTPPPDGRHIGQSPTPHPTSH